MANQEDTNARNTCCTLKECLQSEIYLKIQDAVIKNQRKILQNNLYGED